MITITYTCDKCSHAQDNNTQMWEISLHLEHANQQQNAYISRTPAVKELWCRRCVVKLQLLPFPKAEKNDPPPPPKPTLEDMIREIIHEEAGQ